MDLSKEIKLEKPLPTGTGSGVQIAVLDTGIKEDHPAFKNADIESDGGTYAGDPTAAHGTLTAGILVGSDSSITGLAIGSAIMNLNVSDSAGSISDSKLKGALEQLKSLAGPNGNDHEMIINMSLDGSEHIEGMIKDVVADLIALGCIIVVAGNGSFKSMTQVSSLKDVISVGVFSSRKATDIKDNGFPGKLTLWFLNKAITSTSFPASHESYKDSSAYTAVISGLISRFLSSNETNKDNRLQKVKAFLNEVSVSVQSDTSFQPYTPYRNA